MKLSIRNIQSIENGDFEIAPHLTLVSGRNAVGKSSVASALSLVLGGYKLDKGEGLEFVQRGKTAAKVSLTTDQGVSEIHLPAQTKPETKGERPPTASAYASGSRQLAEITDKKERASAFAEFIQANPSKAELAAALEEPVTVDEKGNPVFTADTNAVWELVELHNWDGAWAFKKEEGARLKGRWEQVTGRARYGAQLGAKWVPEGYDEQFHLFGDEMIKVVESTKEQYEKAIANKAVSEQEKAALEAEAALWDTYIKESEIAKAAYDKSGEAVKAAEEASREEAKKSPTSLQLITPCPHCSEPLVVKDGIPLKPDPKVATPAQVKAAQKIVEQCQERVKEAQKARDSAQTHYLQIQEKANGARKAKEKLAAAESGETVDVAGAREAFDKAQTRLKAWQTWSDASALHESIVKNQAIIDVLSPEGLRQKKLAEALQVVNEQLAKIASDAGWKKVAISELLNVTYDGLGFKRLSASEQFRVNVVLQVWCALVDKSPLVVIDAADILDQSGRNGLLTLLWNRKIRAVVCMTAHFTPEGERVIPDLQKAGVGLTYWVENGTVEPLKELAVK